MLIDDVDIVELVSRYTPLTKDDRDRYWGRCPFCGAEDKAFVVNPTHGLWYCFKCKQGGNSLTFFSLIEKISYCEAMKRLGVTLTPTTRAEFLSEFERFLKENLKIMPPDQCKTLESDLVEVYQSLKKNYNAEQVDAPNQNNTPKQE